jgi:hypothetical protein
MKEFDNDLTLCDDPKKNTKVWEKPVSTRWLVVPSYSGPPLLQPVYLSEIWRVDMNGQLIMKVSENILMFFPWRWLESTSFRESYAAAEGCSYTPCFLIFRKVVRSFVRSSAIRHYIDFNRFFLQLYVMYIIYSTSFCICM